jgi:hypothetical protein
VLSAGVGGEVAGLPGSKSILRDELHDWPTPNPAHGCPSEDQVWQLLGPKYSKAREMAYVIDLNQSVICCGHGIVIAPVRRGTAAGTYRVMFFKTLPVALSNGPMAGVRLLSFGK